MGEWSEYFEDVPAENPANWIKGRFDPAAAADARKREQALRDQAEQATKDSRTLQRKMFEIAENAKRVAAERAGSGDVTIEGKSE